MLGINCLYLNIVVGLVLLNRNRVNNEKGGASIALKHFAVEVLHQVHLSGSSSLLSAIGGLPCGTRGASGTCRALDPGSILSGLSQWNFAAYDRATGRSE